MTNNNTEYEYVCVDCGADRGTTGFVWGACDGCGGEHVIPERYYTVEDRQPVPSEHAPRKYAAYSADGEFVVAEESNVEAWVCVDTEASRDGVLMEVRE